LSIQTRTANFAFKGLSKPFKKAFKRSFKGLLKAWRVPKAFLKAFEMMSQGLGLGWLGSPLEGLLKVF